MSFVKKLLRYLLLPFSIIYGCIVWLRNVLYNKDILKSSSFSIPIINVGNISVGGTGKSPMVLYLTNVLKEKNIAILSRGYKRNTTGFLQYEKGKTTVNEIGDEPFLFAQKNTNAIVAVCEDRVAGVQQLISNNSLDVILLDDALQHRKIKASCNIVLVDYNNPFFNDFYLPTGNLRDAKLRLNDAAVIVVTKCPNDLSKAAADSFVSKMKLGKEIGVFFTAITYEIPVHINTNEPLHSNLGSEIIIVTGIANPTSMVTFLQNRYKLKKQINFSDHFDYSTKQIEEFKNQLAVTKATCIITTEKDAVKLAKLNIEQQLPIYALPIRISFLFDKEIDFQQLIWNEII